VVQLQTLVQTDVKVKVEGYCYSYRYRYKYRYKDQTRYLYGLHEQHRLGASDDADGSLNDICGARANEPHPERGLLESSLKT
jgi:hypothetical protein